MENRSLGRLPGVLVSPGKTFRSIADRPTWFAAWLTLWLIGGGVAFLAFQKVDFAAGIREQLAEQHIEMPAGGEERAAHFGKIAASTVALVFLPLLPLLAAAFYLLFNLFGGELDFKRSLSVVTHANLPRALAALLSLPVILSRSELNLKEIQQGGALRANLSFLAPENASPALLLFLVNLDLFSFWSLALSIVGFHYVAGVNKKTATGLVVLFWLCGLALQIGSTLFAGHVRGGR